MIAGLTSNHSSYQPAVEQQNFMETKTTLEKLNLLRAQLAELEKQRQIELEAEIKGLPAKLGVENMSALIRLLKNYADDTPTATAPTQTSRVGSAIVASDKRKRLDDAQRKALIEDVTVNGMTGAAAAEKYGVSVPTVQNIKKAAGVVRKKRK